MTGGGAKGWRVPLYLALFALYLLHNDLWLWHDGRLVLGLPVGLVYHIGFAVATSVVLTLLVLKAWPHELDAVAGDDDRRGGHR